MNCTEKRTKPEATEIIKVSIVVPTRPWALPLLPSMILVKLKSDMPG